MRIAVDARELHGKPTGVGRYLSEILAAWKELPAAAAHEIILCAPAAGEHGGTAWEQLRLPRLVKKAGADVLFAPGYTAPIFSPAPVVVAIHDVSFAAHPEWFGWREGLRRRTVTTLTARRAACVITISEFSRREIVTHLGIDAARIEVVYIAAARKGPRRMEDGFGNHAARTDNAARTDKAARTDNAARTDSAARTDNAARPFTGRDADSLVLYVGSLFNRRHLPELIDGFGRLARRRSAATLEIVGDDRTNPRLPFDQLVHDTQAADRIRIRSYVDEEELASLYGRARAFVFLSEYEGFGLTPLEALAAGVPVVVLDTPVAREIYGDAAVYVTQPDPAQIDAALERVLFDEAERTRILAAADTVLSRYSWRRCAEQVLGILTRCGSPR